MENAEGKGLSLFVGRAGHMAWEEVGILNSRRAGP